MHVRGVRIVILRVSADRTKKNLTAPKEKETRE